ncbi:hypothetical protein JW707_03465 [Candidatus Woesearchaeota archaeon]|nr:hypothetical protein [Candidatus Woesearchaeota archaeon]
MRLWSLHPKYLDCKGLVALWREGLLAKKVLQGKTKGYRRHPQLQRFRGQPIGVINSYLNEIWKEAEKRCYKFDRNKIGKLSKRKISLNRGQLKLEFGHLKQKLRKRDRKKYIELQKIKEPNQNPVFILKKGPAESWEKSKSLG